VRPVSFKGGGPAGARERRRVGGHLRRRSPFGLGPARLARSDPIRGVRQKSVSRPDDRARPRCLTARPPLLDAFLAHFGGVFGRFLVAHGLAPRFSLSHSRPSELPMFTRHEYRTRARDEWAARSVGRRWCGKLKPQPAG
jgi:hypothetical protein